jgi:hypothetical protein
MSLLVLELLFRFDLGFYRLFEAGYLPPKVGVFLQEASTYVDWRDNGRTVCFNPFISVRHGLIWIGQQAAYVFLLGLLNFVVINFSAFAYYTRWCYLGAFMYAVLTLLRQIHAARKQYEWKLQYARAEGPILDRVAYDQAKSCLTAMELTFSCNPLIYSEEDLKKASVMMDFLYIALYLNDAYGRIEFVLQTLENLTLEDPEDEADGKNRLFKIPLYEQWHRLIMVKQSVDILIHVIT